MNAIKTFAHVIAVVATLVAAGCSLLAPFAYQFHLADHGVLNARSVDANYGGDPAAGPAAVRRTWTMGVNSMRRVQGIVLVLVILTLGWMFAYYLERTNGREKSSSAERDSNTAQGNGNEHDT